MNRSVPVIADLMIDSPFCVYNLNSGNYIYQYLDSSDSGDLPPDIGCLPVLGLRSVLTACSKVLYIDTEVN